MLEKRTVKNYILFYLQTHPGWNKKKIIEEQAQYWGCNADNIDRRLRELFNDGKIEKRLTVYRTVEYARLNQSH